MKNGKQVYADNVKWFYNNKLHREDGPAVEYSFGRKEWWYNGKRHRIGGPAIEWSSGDKEWWCDGSRHRLDGPAVEWCTAGKNQWWLKGLYYNNKEDWFEALGEDEKLTYLFRIENGKL